MQENQREKRKKYFYIYKNKENEEEKNALLVCVVIVHQSRRVCTPLSILDPTIQILFFFSYGQQSRLYGQHEKDV